MSLETGGPIGQNVSDYRSDFTPAPTGEPFGNQGIAALRTSAPTESPYVPLVDVRTPSVASSEPTNGITALHRSTSPGARVASVLAAGALLTGCSTIEGETTYEPKPIIAPTACAADGTPETGPELLCEDRRTGTLAIVVIDDLAPLNPPEHDVLVDAGEQATDLLRASTDGAVDLQPHILEAAPEVSDLIRERNNGFTEGEYSGCVDSDDVPNQMSDIVAEVMPELTSMHTQIAVVGGMSCGIDPETGVESQVIGRANVDDGRIFTDIYLGSISDTEANIQDDEEFGETIAHESAHNYGFGHTGVVSYVDNSLVDSIAARDTISVDLDTLLVLSDGIAPYGDIGNLMSDVPAELGGDDHADNVNLTNAVQEQYIASSADAAFNPAQNIVRSVTGSDEFTVRPEDPTSPRALQLPLAENVWLGAYEFSQINFEPQTRDPRQMDVYMSSSPESGYRETAWMGTFALPEDGDREFTLGGFTVVVNATDTEAVQMQVTV